MPTDVGWVDLAPVSRADQVIVAVAAALGVRERPGQTVLELVAEAIGAGPHLLVVDNCEHLIGGCAETAEGLLRRCSELRLLATSREPLGLDGETTWLVPILSVPDAQAPASIADVAQSEAVQLFLERAAARAPLVLDVANGAQLAEICRRLDGIPLALELAAARVAALGLEGVHARLDDRFGVLIRTNERAPTRQQTLWAAVDWSYNLLTQPERDVFERLTVFAGGFTLEAAEATVVGDSIQPADVVNLVTRLVDKSVLVADAGTAGTVRYRLLETLREYGLEQLDSQGGSDAARRRHAVYFAEFARRAAAELWGKDEQAWLTRLDLEHDNLRAAIDWCLNADANLGLRLVRDLWGYWLLRGMLVEGDRRMLSMLERAVTPSPERAATLLRTAPLAMRLATQQSARHRMQESYSEFRHFGDASGQVQALHDLAVVDTLQLEYADATARCEQALELARAADLEAADAGVTHSLAAIKYLSGDFASARRLLDLSLALLNALDPATHMLPTLLNMGCWMLRQGNGPIRFAWEDTLAVFRNLTAASARGYVLANLANLARASRDAERARMLLHESLVSFKRADDRHGVAQTLCQLGNLFARTRDYQRAQHCLEDSLAIRKELGDGRGVGLSLVGMARLAVDARELRRAHELYAQCLAHFRMMGDNAATCSVLEDLADLALNNGETERAETLLCESLDVRQNLGADWAFARNGALGPGFSHQLIATARSCLPDPPTALDAFFRELVDMRRRWHRSDGLMLLFEDLASAKALGGDQVRAARLFGFAQTLGSQISTNNLPAEVERGRRFSLEQALAHAFCAPVTSGVSRRTHSRPGLTEREADVLRLVAQGMTNREIGIQLVVSERTVAKHLDNVFRKIGVTSRAAATAFAIRAGIVPT